MATPIRSIRIAHDEWAEIQRAAGIDGASAFIREAALERARGGQQKLPTGHAPKAATPVTRFTCSVCGRTNAGRCPDHTQARQEPEASE